MPPNLRDVRLALSDIRTESSTPIALIIFLANVVLYFGTFIGIILLPWWSLKFLCAILNGLVIGTLFVVGHDCCHGSFTPSSRLNKWTGRICFLPSLTPFSSWDLGHNKIHHGWTNLRAKDYVWVPFSKQEFDQLSPIRQRLEKLYRSFFGVALYYFIEIWWKHIMIPTREDLKQLQKTVFKFDVFLVAGYFLFEILVIMFLTNFTSKVSGNNSSGSLLSLFVFGILIPFTFWNWLVGFLTYQHHTHLKARWYKNQTDWSYFSGQIGGSVHIVFPWLIARMFHNIMDHTAHHADTRIPLYNLPVCQRQLELTFLDDVIIQRWSLSECLRTFSACQLYDYENHSWNTFSGINRDIRHFDLRQIKNDPK